MGEAEESDFILAESWLHTNDATEGILRDLLPKTTLVTDGDCGSVWGEYHEPEFPCPHPHWLIRNPTDEELLVLTAAGVAFTVSGGDWSDHIKAFNWREDPECPYRTIFVTDYRLPREPPY